MARVAYGMAVASRLVRTEIVDTGALGKFSKQHGAMMIPKTFFNYGESFIGVETEERILGRVLKVR